MCHSVTNYECYKGLYSSFNSMNMFETQVLQSMHGVQGLPHSYLPLCPTHFHNIHKEYLALDKDFLKRLRQFTDSLKEEFFIVGETLAPLTSIIYTRNTWHTEIQCIN